MQRQVLKAFTLFCALSTLRRFAHLMVKKDVGCPETKKDLLRKVKSAISSTAERFSGNMQNVRPLESAVYNCGALNTIKSNLIDLKIV